MIIEEGRLAAVEWVRKHAERQSGFKGAYFSGSTIGMAGDAVLPSGSDIDIMVVTEDDHVPPKLGKFIYRGFLLEVSYVPESQLVSVEKVLGSYHLAGSFRTDTIITDPTGLLRRLQREGADQFADSGWVRRRCEDAWRKSERGLRSLNVGAPLPDKVTAWLFPTGVMTHVLLTAALRNPTVRRRYLAVREVLNEYGMADHYEELLGLLGCTDMTARRVQDHLDALAHTFDIAAAVGTTAFPFRADITPAARPVVIDGSLELIRAGDHREAVFWIAATFARCHQILAADAQPAIQQELLPAFEELTADLGIGSDTALIRRADEVLRFLPELWSMAEKIMAANPEIVRR